MSLIMSVELITPYRASEYLKANTHNRTLRKTYVEDLAREMRAGHWGLSHQGIAFNCDGTLLDGQHRLHAVVRANKPVHMVVTRGVPSETRVVMDTHAKRTASDALSLHRGEAISAQKIAAVKAAIMMSAAKRSQATNIELDAALDIFSDALLFCRSYIDRKNNRGSGSSAVWGAVLLAWFYVDDLNRLSQFCEIVSGDVMAKRDEDNAPHLMREWLFRHGQGTGVLRSEAFKKVQRAIKSFMAFEPLGKLYATTWFYPYPLISPIRISSKENMR